MNHLALLVNHVKAQVILRATKDGETRLATDEDGSLHGIHLLARERGGGVDHIVNLGACMADMLEVVDVAAEVDIDMVPAQNGVQSAL